MPVVYVTRYMLQTSKDAFNLIQSVVEKLLYFVILGSSCRRYRPRTQAFRSGFFLAAFCPEQKSLGSKLRQDSCCGTFDVAYKREAHACCIVHVIAQIIGWRLLAMQPVRHIAVMHDLTCQTVVIARTLLV